MISHVKIHMFQIHVEIFLGEVGLSAKRLTKTSTDLTKPSTDLSFVAPLSVHKYISRMLVKETVFKNSLCMLG